ncbi:hypothetical protein CR513_59434, partial [Mucuna pruriens]
MIGTKQYVKAMKCKNESVRERSTLEGRTRANSGGRSGSDNDNMSIVTLVRIQCLENPRFPSQSSFMEGESRLEIKPKGVVNRQQGWRRLG